MEKVAKKKKNNNNDDGNNNKIEFYEWAHIL